MQRRVGFIATGDFAERFHSFPDNKQWQLFASETETRGKQRF